MLRYRIASAFILIPIVLGSVYFGGLGFFAVVTLALLIAGYEFFEMARHAGHRPNTLARRERRGVVGVKATPPVPGAKGGLRRAAGVPVR